MNTETVREVRLDVDGQEVVGDLGVPEGAQGLVLFAHGSGSGRFSPRNRAVAAGLRDAGLGTLLFDLLTGPEEAEDRATGHLRFDIPFLAERLDEVVSWTRRHDATKDLGVGLFGSSTGAGAAIRAAAARPADVQAVVGRGGRPDLAGDALPRLAAPTLLIVGGRDEAVLHMNRDAMARMRCEVDLQVVPGASHLFEEPGALEQVVGLAASWFRHHLH